MYLPVRFGSEHCPTEFVRPDEAEVQRLASGMPQGVEGMRVRWCWDWVSRNVRYPLDARGQPSDRHVLHAFVAAEPIFLPTSFRVNRISDEFWQYPSETIAWGYGDCEDTSILLCSMLRNFIPPDRVSVVVGGAGLWEHAWVELDGEIYETTLDSIPQQPGRYLQQAYRPLWAFNDKIIKGEPALARRGDERAKLKWLSSCWNCATKT